MARGYSAEMVGVLDGTVPSPGKADGRVIGAKVRAFTATFDMAQATVKKASGDDNLCFRIPAGYKPLVGWLVASATMGTATIAIGPAASPGKYRAAAAFTAVDTPTPFMASTGADDTPLAADEDVLITIAAAALPGAGVLSVIMFASAR